jgi:hypothetical protein
MMSFILLNYTKGISTIWFEFMVALFQCYFESVLASVWRVDLFSKLLVYKRTAKCRHHISYPEFRPMGARKSISSLIFILTLASVSLELSFQPLGYKIIKKPLWKSSR